jgi:hypothetical protein
VPRCLLPPTRRWRPDDTLPRERREVAQREVRLPSSNEQVDFAFLRTSPRMKARVPVLGPFMALCEETPPRVGLFSNRSTAEVIRHLIGRPGSG